jgi:hypothetical protein
MGEDQWEGGVKQNARRNMGLARMREKGRERERHEERHTRRERERREGTHM